MNQTAAQKTEFVEDVVEQLTGSADGVSADLCDQMQRAAEEFDNRTAVAFAKSLLDSLCDDPTDVRKLEALLILGLAHPAVLERHRISLSVEGRRLAVLLERSGEDERARSLLEVLLTRLPEDKTVHRDLAAIMRRTGETDQLIDRYLSRADEAMSSGKPMQAIPWLQEVLLHDRTRRDVARMIRDLREQETTRQGRRRRYFRAVLVTVLLGGLLTFVAMREMRLEEEYRSLPKATPGDLQTTHVRLEKIGQMIDENKAWVGLFRAVTERSRLQQQLDKMEARVSEERRLELEAHRRNLDLAEKARVNAIASARRGDYDLALFDFRRSLELSPPEWPHRARVEADVAAILAFQRGDQ